jgi:hypothetical protein
VILPIQEARIKIGGAQILDRVELFQIGPLRALDLAVKMG